MSIPAVPMTHLILIQATLALGSLKANLDFPSTSRDIDQCLLRHLAAWSINDVIGVFLLLIEAASYQQVMSKAALLWGYLQAPQFSKRPVVQALAFGASAC